MGTGRWWSGFPQTARFMAFFDRCRQKRLESSRIADAAVAQRDPHQLTLESPGDRAAMTLAENSSGYRDS